jgi:hypothetical protein
MSGTKAGKGPSTIKRRKRGHDEQADETAMEDESTLFVSTASNTARNKNRSARAAPSNAGQAEQIISLMAEITALKEGIRARDATLEALEPEIAALKEGIRARDATLEVLEPEITALKEGIRARDATLEALEPTSLQTLLRLGSLTMKQIGTSSSHLKVKGHKIAEATENPIVLCRNMDISKVPQGLSSELLVRNSATGDEKEACIGTEADVTALVTCLVHDASRILNFVLGDFKIHVLQERSLFSGRPDILVAYSTEYSIPLLVIEVKKPLPEGDNICQYGRVLGQVYDYAKFLNAIGSPLPFVIWTSLIESRICWNGSAKDGKVTKEFKEEVYIASPPVDSPPCDKPR